MPSLQEDGRDGPSGHRLEERARGKAQQGTVSNHTAPRKVPGPGNGILTTSNHRRAPGSGILTTNNHSKVTLTVSHVSSMINAWRKNVTNDGVNAMRVKHCAQEIDKETFS